MTPIINIRLRIDHLSNHRRYIFGVFFDLAIYQDIGGLSLSRKKMTQNTCFVVFLNHRYDLAINIPVFSI